MYYQVARDGGSPRIIHTFPFTRFTLHTTGAAATWSGPDCLHCRMCSFGILVLNDLIFYLTNMEMPDKNGDLDILNHMVRPRNTHDQTREILRKLALILLREAVGLARDLTTSLTLKKPRFLSNVEI